MKHEITMKNLSDNNWKVGMIDGISYQAKVYEEPSVYGIRKGNISKLWIKGICSYDRGWDQRPQTPEAKELVKAICAFFRDPKNCKAE